MSRHTRLAVRVVLPSLMAVALTVVAHSFLATTGIAMVAADASEPTGISADSPPLEGLDPGGDPTGADPLQVETGLRVASDDDLPGENWSADRVRGATREGRNLTVVTTQGTFVSDEQAEITAFLGDGTIVYHEDQYPVYFDVDPVPGERYTVEYVAARRLAGEACSGFEGTACTRNVVRRVNLTSGASRTVYAETTPRVYSARWHDVDRLNETTLVVADIVGDGVFAVDTRTGSVRWRWNASQRFSSAQGGAPGDWTHLNDVEVLSDGRVMASVRNMDSVVFLSVEGGQPTVDESWTLGEDGNHAVLHEQHNPDYLPAERGGPAVIAADSENGRVVEYHRSDGDWERQWQWRDVRLQWPRDADRLPGGNTLVADTHGNRVLEVGPDGDVVWAARVGMPYEVERLGTGDESSTGRAKGAGGADGAGGTEGANGVDGAETDGAGDADGEGGAASRSAVDRVWLALKDVTPSVVANAALYLAPSWIRFADLAFLALFATSGFTWLAAEVYWSAYSVVGISSRGLGAIATAGRAVGRRVSGR